MPRGRSALKAPFASPSARRGESCRARFQDTFGIEGCQGRLLLPPPLAPPGSPGPSQATAATRARQRSESALLASAPPRLLKSSISSLTSARAARQAFGPHAQRFSTSSSQGSEQAATSPARRRKSQRPLIGELRPLRRTAAPRLGRDRRRQDPHPDVPRGTWPREQAAGPPRTLPARIDRGVRGTPRTRPRARGSSRRQGARARSLARARRRLVASRRCRVNA